MGKTFEAQLIGTDLKVGIVVGRFNEFITSKLLDGALDGLKDTELTRKILILLGFQVHLKYHLFQSKWLKQEITTL